MIGRQDELTPRDGDARFDRLVDGELTAEEYRSLLAGLEHEPGGWRDCALAFLEAQALGTELGSVRRALDMRPAAPHKPATMHRPWWPKLGTLLAMAASFALAFGLGVTLPRIWFGDPQDGMAGGNLPSELLANRDAPGDERLTVLRPIANVQVVVGGDDGQQRSAGELPVYEIRQNLDEYLRESQPGLDPYVLDWLQRHHDVEVEQRLIPGRLDDGRPMYVPVEQYTITPVKRSY